MKITRGTCSIAWIDFFFLPENIILNHIHSKTFGGGCWRLKISFRDGWRPNKISVFKPVFTVQNGIERRQEDVHESMWRLVPLLDSSSSTTFLPRSWTQSTVPRGKVSFQTDLISFSLMAMIVMCKWAFTLMSGRSLWKSKGAKMSFEELI